MNFQVVFADIVRYSKRNTKLQAKVIEKFTEMLKITIGSLESELGFENDIIFKNSLFFPTGDGVAIILKQELFKDIKDLHLLLAKKLLKNLHEENSVNYCTTFLKNNVCRCHENFYLRIGLSMGVGIPYKDITGSENIASSDINLASRIMNLVDVNQIGLCKNSYDLLSEITDDLDYFDLLFMPCKAKIKHDKIINYYTYFGEREETFINKQNGEKIDFNIEQSCDNNNSMVNVLQTISSDIKTINQKSGKSEHSLFGYRMNHYSEEKDLICKNALQFIIENKSIQKKLEENSDSKIFLLIDSGSTTFPVFKYLCNNFDDHKDIFSRIEIITNNIEGISYMSKYGRVGNQVTADMLYSCNVISGKAEGKYSAILGQKSLTSLSNYIDEIRKEGNNIIISLITGNYISIDDGILWRGDYHGEMKNSYIENSDYVFILSPLGKIFNLQKDVINKIIEENREALSKEKIYNKLTENMEVNEYGEEVEKLLPVSILDKKSIHLFTTTRGQVSKNYTYKYPSELIGHFTHISTKLQNIFEENFNAIEFQPILDSGDTASKIKSNKENYSEEIYNYEFPHKEICKYMKEIL